MWALRIPRLGISIILPKNHCMDHMVEALGVDKILKMFKGQNKLSKVISFSNYRFVKSEHAYSLRCCLTNANNIHQFQTLNEIDFWKIHCPDSDCGGIHKLQFILYTALLMKVLFKVIIHSGPENLKKSRPKNS